jgi:hypothetical protein
MAIGNRSDGHSNSKVVFIFKQISSDRTTMLGRTVPPMKLVDHCHWISDYQKLEIAETPAAMEADRALDREPFKLMSFAFHNLI